MTFSVRT